MSIMEWTKLERAFAVEAFFSSSRSIVATQHAFRRHFNIAPVVVLLAGSRLFHG